MKFISIAERIWRTIEISKEEQLAGIEKQLEEMKKQLALLAAAMEAVLQKYETEAKKVINYNKARVEEYKIKKVERKNFKDLK